MPSLEQRTEWETENKMRIRQKIQMQTNLDKAIELTALYYGLRQESGRIANGPLEGYKTEKSQFVYTSIDAQGNYTPTYFEMTFPSKPDKEPHYMMANFENPADGMQARTLEDGSINVSIEAFSLAIQKNSPRLLAKTLHHEGVHRKQLVAGGWSSEQEMETAAYSESFSLANTFELNQTEKDNVESKMQDWERALDDVKYRGARKTDPFTSRFIQREFKKGYEENSGKHSQANSDRQTLEKGLETARETVAKEREERRTREGDERKRHDAEDRRSRWARLEIWTSYACMYTNPSAPKGTEQQLREILLNHYVVLTDEEVGEGLAAPRNELSSCQKKLIATIRKAPGPLDAAWLVEKFDYDNAGGRVGEAFRGIFGGFIASIDRAIDQGVAEIVRTIVVPFSAVGKATQDKIQSEAGGGGSGDRSEGDGADRRGSGSYRPGAPDRQLRGIAGGKREF